MRARAWRVRARLVAGALAPRPRPGSGTAAGGPAGRWPCEGGHQAPLPQGVGRVVAVAAGHPPAPAGGPARPAQEGPALGRPGRATWPRPAVRRAVASHGSTGATYSWRSPARRTMRGRLLQHRRPPRPTTPSPSRRTASATWTSAAVWASSLRCSSRARDQLGGHLPGRRPATRRSG